MSVPRRLVWAFLVAASFALPGVAQAHGGGNYTAGAASTVPTIDGVVNAAEWADATPYSVSFGTLGNAIVRFLHRSGDLYVGAVVQDPAPSLTPSFDVFFDNNHDGVKDAGDDVWLSFAGASTGSDFFWNPAAPGPGGPSHYSDSTGGGTNETVAAGTGAAGAVSFELRHPLCSADTAHDICASIGQALGVNFQYERGAIPGDFVDAPGSNQLDPSLSWANLTLTAGDAVAPTVSVTQPAAGSVLRGTVAVAADASDNVGVTAVDFRYFGGALPYVELGTDTEAPYTATFDSTQVANTAPLGGTVYAVAHDAAGHSTTVGNGVTVDNTPPSRIVFETDRDGNSEIYSMNPDGTNLVRLTNSVAVDTRPSLSPDGSLIAWQSGNQVWLMNSDGTNKRALTSLGTNAAPAFSPDGTKIAFESNRGGDYDIWVMNVDGTGQANLTNIAGDDVSATWSPDGTKLAFDSTRSGNRDVFTMNVDGTGQTNLPSNSPQLDADPDWSPDGQKILFVSGRSGFTSVWSMNADGSGGELNVTSSGNFDADPAWSPDGNHIVFARDNTGGITFNIWTARANGTAQFRVTGATSTQRNSFADWGSPVADQPGPIFTVTTADDHDDGSCTPGDCALREAIDAANAHPNSVASGLDVIEFAIPTIGGTVMIAPATALPPITDPVVVDGGSQLDLLGQPTIFIDGTNVPFCTGCEASGLVVHAGGAGSTIKGIGIGNFDRLGILIDGGGDNVVENSWIGIGLPDMFAYQSNGSNGLAVSGGIGIVGSSNNRIGGPASGQRVYVGTNGDYGGEIVIAGVSSGNVVQGSYIGVGSGGTRSDTFDTETGVRITGGASGNTIGGSRAGGRGNLITGFYGSGVVLDGAGSGNVVAGNSIGVDINGETGESPAIGVEVKSSAGTVVGDDVSPPGNAVTDFGNVLGGAGTAGVSISGSSPGTKVAGNFVGIDRAGTSTSVGNRTGVSVTSSNVTVGPGNTVAHNAFNGVEVNGEFVSGVRIVANSIHDNGTKGIALLSGANGGLQAPAIGSATIFAGTTTVSGSVTAPRGATYFVELFTNGSCDPSGSGEGKTYVGFATVSIPATAPTTTAPFTTSLSGIGAGTPLTATLTSSSTSNTSAFSACATMSGSGTTVQIAPTADAFVAAGAPNANFGTLDYADVYGGSNPSCVLSNGRSYTLMRFDLSSIPAGVTINDARLEATTRAGWAQDGDPAHWALFIPNDTWTETGVTWNTRPADGLTTEGGTAYAGGADIRQSSLSFGAADVWRNGCSQDPDPAGNQTKVFPSTTDGLPRTVAQAKAGLISEITSQRTGDGKLSLELWAPNCPVCSVGINLAYWGRYFTREANNPAVRPRLIVTYEASPPIVTGLTITGPATVDAGANVVPLAGIPPAALVVPQASGTQAAPVNQSPVNQSPVNQLPVNQLPVNQSPVNQSPVNQLPVNQSPVNQSGVVLGLDFGSLVRADGPLGDTALSTIPLLREGGWAALLTGTPLAGTPEQSVTLRRVFSLLTLPEPLQPASTNPLRFADIDFSRSPLGSLPAMTLALGQLPVSGIPGINWCTLFQGPPLNCTSSLPPTTSLLSAALAGAPVNQSPVNQSPVNQSLIDALAAAQAPVNQLPVNQLPVNQLPVNQLPVNQSRILSLPVNQLPVNQSPVNQLPLNAILVANAPVNQSPVNQLPVNQLPVNQSVLQCGGLQCQGTLGQYVGRVAQGKKLGDLRAALPNDVPSTWTVADLQDFGSLIVGDLLKSLPQPNTLTLADVLALALFANNPESFAFETLNIFDTSLSLFANPLGTAPYTVAFALTPNGGPSGVPSTVDVSVTLPRTFAYAAGTSKLAESPATCGTGAAVADPTVTQVTSGVTKATWSVSGAVGSSFKLCFSARPGIVLGPQSAQASAKPDGGVAVAANAPEPVTVGDGSESSNNDPPTSPTLATSSLHLSYLTSAADVDYYRITVPGAGTRTTFHLSHLPADYDLVVYGPQQTALRPVVASAPPLDGAPLTDTGSDLTHATDALSSQTLDDLRLQALPLVGVSASRGTDPEDITVLSDGGGGSYTVQVTSYNGATSADPYMLRVTTEPPRVPVTTAPRTVTGAPGAVIGALPTGFNTLFVVDRARLEGLYGATAATNVMNAITGNQASFASLGFPNAVLSVDAYAAVQTAYGNWDASPGKPDLANKVVAAINGIVDAQVRAKPNGAGLKYIVIVGGDRVIPQGRLGDFTVAANENGYADTFDRSSDLYATLHAGQVLSDDPYATLEPVPYLNRQLYIPRLAVGRLVETPAEIVATLSRFTAFSGRLDPSTSLVTGYDFMQDGAAAINAPFASRFRAGATTLPTLIASGAADWTTNSLINAFLPTGDSAPSITSLNGHADHFEFAPPAVAPPYFNSGNLPLGPTSTPAGSTGPLVNRLVFSMGCHAGLSVSDAVVTANTYDWAQAYARNGVGAYLGNTGYGYGDSLVVAYSEQLDSIFARKIAAGSTVGNALASAKQEYFGGLGVFGVYDEKAMAEFTLYGLPMWSVTMPGSGLAPLSTETASTPSSGGPQVLSVQAATAVPTSTAVVTDSATGLQAEAFTLDGITNTEHPTTLPERYWSGPDGVQVTHFRPLQPKAFVDVTGTAGHGALITELRQQADTPGVDPVFARPIVDTQGAEPELTFGDVAFPSRLQALRTFRQDGVLKQRVVLMTGQFFTGSSPGSTGSGVQRLYTRIDARVLRSTSNDFVPPAFTRIEATKVDTTAAFAVDVTDLTQTGAAGIVKRVLVAVRRGSETTWRFSDLGQVGTSARWSGGVPLGTAAAFEYFVQAVDAAGNVGISTNKGFYFAAAEPVAPSGNVTVAPAAAAPSNGWFTGSTPVAVDGPAGVTLEASIDGGPFNPVPPQPTVSGDGVHVVEARGSNGGSASTLIPIDNAAPAITIGAPAASGSYTVGSTAPADFACSDAGSGVASCAGAIVAGPTGIGPIANGAALPTGRVGTYTLEVTSTDVVGHTSVATSSYTITLLGSTAFVRGGKIWVVKPDGSGSFAPRQLTQLTGLDAGTWVDEQPAVSPDGLRVVFARRTAAAAKPQLWVIDADGSNAKKLIDDPTKDYTAPAWAPTGTQIAFESTRTGSKGRDIWTGAFSPASGGSLSSLVNRSNAIGDDVTPDWAPSGARVAFASNRKQSQFDIYTMKADGSDQQKLTNDPKTDVEPSYSPSFAVIVFSSDRAGGTGGFELYAMGSADGNSQTRITSSAGSDGQPHFVAPLSVTFVSARTTGAGPGLYSIAPSAVPPVKLAGTGSGDQQPG